MRSRLIYIAILTLFVLVLLKGFSSFQRPIYACEDLSYEKKILMMNAAVFAVFVADTSQKQTCGLSGFEDLPQNYGMLFVFKQEGFPNIWMKDMKFPIDIFWLNSNLDIVSLKENASPDSFPDVFKSDEEALYVLELEAGKAKEHSLKKGERGLLFD